MQSTRLKEKAIRYPGVASEFEIQAYLYHELRELGYDVRGEVLSEAGRLDLVVYDADRMPIRIIEVKKHRCETVKRFRGKGKTTGKAQHRAQVKRYCELGLPVDVVASLKLAKTYVEHVKERGFAETNQWYW